MSLSFVLLPSVALVSIALVCVCFPLYVPAVSSDRSGHVAARPKRATVGKESCPATRVFARSSSDSGDELNRAYSRLSLAGNEVQQRCLRGNRRELVGSGQERRGGGGDAVCLPRLMFVSAWCGNRDGMGVGDSTCSRRDFGWNPSWAMHYVIRICFLSGLRCIGICGM